MNHRAEGPRIACRRTLLGIPHGAGRPVILVGLLLLIASGCGEDTHVTAYLQDKPNEPPTILAQSTDLSVDSPPVVVLPGDTPPELWVLVGDPNGLAGKPQ